MVSEYLERIERAHLDILESLEPVNRSITLWWGFDGLQVNEGGALEWVSRRKKKPETCELAYEKVIEALTKGAFAFPTDFINSQCTQSQMGLR